MIPENDPVAEFKEIQGLYDTAERFIKEVELCHESVPFPAINQLRYAGHHLLKGLVAGEEQGLAVELGDVKDHCHRAMYEAADAGLIYLFRLRKRFQDDFSDVPITPVVPEYQGVVLIARDAQQLLVHGRLQRESPKEQVDEYMTKFRELRNGVNSLEAARDELNKAKLDKRRNDRRFILQALFWLTMAFIGALGLILRRTT